MYLKSDTLLLDDVFENFMKMCLNLFSASAWQSALKKSAVKLELTRIDILCIVWKEIRGGICHEIHRYAKANNKYIKYYDRNKELSYNQYYHVNNLCGWEMLQKLSVNGFELVGNTSEFDGSFVESYNEKKTLKNVFSNMVFDFLKSHINFIMIYYFYLGKKNWKYRKTFY